MKDTKLRKHLTQEQSILRSQIADCLRYYKKDRGYWIEREDVEVHEDTIITTYEGASLADLIEYVDPKHYKNVFVRGKSYEDYDGQDGSQVETYSLRKQTDKEYFDSICSCIIPAEYQSSQYNLYRSLKKQFEGK